MIDCKQKLAPMRCISVTEDTKRYFAEVTIKEADGRKAFKMGYLMGVLEAAIEHNESEDEILVIPVGEIVQLMRDVMEVKGENETL